MTSATYSIRGLGLLDLFGNGFSEVAHLAWTHSQREDSPISILDHNLDMNLKKLFDVVQGALTKGWDGYDALPADFNAVRYAIVFLQNLPVDVPSPEFAIDVDGDVAIEWDYDSRLISIRIGRDGTFYYAGMDDRGSFHGEELHQESIPEAISRGIARVANTTRV